METIQQKHKEMVLRLAKPGKDVLAELTPFDCDLVHMGGCLMGEAVELYEASDDDNHLEELGDCEYYLVKCLDLFGLTYDCLKFPEAPYLTIAHHRERLLIAGGQFWDVVKRVTVYRKGLFEPEKSYGGATIQFRAEYLLAEFAFNLDCIYKALGLTRDQVLQANLDKLSKRYGSGKYSNDQAVARADKEG